MTKKEIVRKHMTQAPGKMPRHKISYNKKAMRPKFDNRQHHKLHTGQCTVSVTIWATNL